MLHSTPMYIQSKENHIVGDCSTNGDSTSGGSITGSVIDCLALPGRFSHAQPVLAGTHPGATSTAGLNRISVSVKLQHGNSSGGGDMADWWDDIPGAQVYLASERSTDQKSWSTGTLRLQYGPKAYPLLGSNRFIRAAAVVTRIGGTTATAAGNLTTVHLGVNMLKRDEGDPHTSVKSFFPTGDSRVLNTTASAT